MPGISPKTRNVRKRSSVQPHDPQTEVALKELQTLPGIGPVRARALIKAGVRTLNDLKSEAVFSELPNATKVALNFKLSPMYKWDARVALSSYSSALPPKYTLELAGEIRRGQDSSILSPFLIFHPDAPVPSPPTNHLGLRPKPQRRASKTGNLTNDLLDTALRHLKGHQHLSETIRQSNTHWEGVALSPGERLAPRYWHVSLRLYNPASYPTAMIYHTGDDKFLNHLAAHAQRNRMYLDEWGLWAIRKGDMASPGSTEFLEMVSVKTEEELMVKLGLEAYVPPEKRNFGNILMKRGKK
ncbi:hypothetical protein BOTBODRAFT_50937 [Botryobasidium botryosum FD-172 SS1]|uniref:DNA polymerase beta thumb domain-containing protein n=1 Tax=Botryobasidium botryosum (strain FD-172 SS1) TaxID=930990 RepID=A0A067N1T4_BOTB1|nr:hypothetical protein BOTBODRAFT_50937 [Botryobasidium botryosum FD-172 SS1]